MGFRTNAMWFGRRKGEGREARKEKAVGKINVSITLVISLLKLNITVSLSLININWKNYRCRNKNAKNNALFHERERLICHL